MVHVSTVLSTDVYSLLRGVPLEQHVQDVQRSIQQTRSLVTELNKLFSGRKFIPNPGSFSEIKIASGEVILNNERLIVNATYYSATNEVFVKVRRTDSLEPRADFDNIILSLINNNGDNVGFDGNFNYNSNSLGLHARVNCPKDATELRVMPNF